MQNARLDPFFVTLSLQPALVFGKTLNFSFPDSLSHAQSIFALLISIPIVFISCILPLFIQSHSALEGLGYHSVLRKIAYGFYLRHRLSSKDGYKL